MKTFTNLGLVLVLAACSAGPTDPDPLPRDDPDDPISIPALGTESSFDLVTWNVEFFGASDGGPTDDVLQLRRVRDVIRGTDADLWAVQEIADGSDFDSLLGELDGYRGLLANDPSVTDGAAFYSDFGNQELKVGLIYKESVVEVLSARVVLTELDHAFAGRPPLEVHVRLTIAAEIVEAYLLVVHMKAGVDADDYERRATAAGGLKAYLDDVRADDVVWVAGDFNDDVDASIRVPEDTPYRAFVDDALRWRFLTGTLSELGLTTIIGFDEPIDHVLASDEAVGLFIEGSALRHPVDTHIDDYANTTSDHYPVITRFDLGG